jgi:hypothetical protein
MEEVEGKKKSSLDVWGVTEFLMEKSLVYIFGVQRKSLQER